MAAKGRYKKLYYSCFLWSGVNGSNLFEAQAQVIIMGIWHSLPFFGRLRTSRLQPFGPFRISDWLHLQKFVNLKMRYFFVWIVPFSWGKIGIFSTTRLGSHGVLLVTYPCRESAAALRWGGLCPCQWHLAAPWFSEGNLPGDHIFIEWHHPKMEWLDITLFI